jgi:hypothetical protein
MDDSCFGTAIFAQFCTGGQIGQRSGTRLVRCYAATLRNRPIVQAKGLKNLYPPTFIYPYVAKNGGRRWFVGRRRAGNSLTTSFWGQLIFLVYGFFSGNPFTGPTKKINCPKKEVRWSVNFPGGSAPRTTDNHHFWRRRDKRPRIQIFQPFRLDNRPISQRSGTMPNKARAATLADTTPCAKSREGCCTKTAIVHSDAATNQTKKEVDEG